VPWAILRVFDKGVTPMAQFWLNVFAAVVAAIVMLIIDRWSNRR
jgi:hypothetical protein